MTESKPTPKRWEPRTTRRWRTGRANPRNIYWLPDGADPALEPRGWERQIGTLDNPELAAAAVMAHNAYLDSHEAPREQA